MKRSSTIQDDPVSFLKSQGYVFQDTPASPQYNIIISGLASSVNEDHLRDIFKDVRDIFLLRAPDGKSRNKALMRFDNEERAQEVLGFSEQIHGRKADLIKIVEQLTKVQVYNIATSVQHTQVLNIFKHCGSLSGALQSDGDAVFIFRTAEEAEKALLLNGLVLEGLPIRVFRTYKGGDLFGGPPQQNPGAKSSAFGGSLRTFGGSPIENKPGLQSNSNGGGLFGSFQAGPHPQQGGLFGGNNHGGGDLFGQREAPKVAVRENMRLRYERDGYVFGEVVPSPLFEVVITGFAPNIHEILFRNSFVCEDAVELRNESGISRGTAFLKFANNESLRRTVEHLKTINGVSTETLASSRSRVLVYNITHGLNSGLLMETFGRCGTIESTQVKSVEGYGFINFQKEEDAETALQLDGLILGQSPLRLCIPDKSPQAQFALNLLGAQPFFGGRNIKPEGAIFGGFPQKNNASLFGGNGGSNTIFGSFGGTKNENTSGLGRGIFDNRSVSHQQESSRRTPVVKTKAQSMLEGLFASKKFADLTFEVQDEEILAHKSVVSESSKYFEDLFSAEESSEPKMTKITISNVSPATFKALLEYMYCEEVKFDEDLVIELLKLSNKYIITKLKRKCEDTLASLLKAENFSKLAKVAEEYQTVGLRESLIEFIGKNGIKVIKNDQMDEIPKTLLVDLVQRLSKK